MSENQTPNSVPRHAKSAMWQKLIAEHVSSGETVMEFCRARGINRETFKYWRKKIPNHLRSESSVRHPSRFVAVGSGDSPAATTRSITPRIALPNGVTIDFGVGLDSPFARQLLLNLCGIGSTGGTHAKS